MLARFESVIVGISLGMAVSVIAEVHYVDANSASPAPPFTTWPTAAATIQDAVDAAIAGDEIVVTNGIYSTGGRAVYGIMTNRVAVDKPLEVRSVNGPKFTIIQGYQVPSITNGDGAISCVYLTNGASLSGFTVTNGATRVSGDYFAEWSGGGVRCQSEEAIVSNCVVTGNSAAYLGGGIFRGTIIDCTLARNSVWNWGGGASRSSLNRCTLFDNSAMWNGGGAESCGLTNCVLSGNSAGAGGGAALSTLVGCVLTVNSAEYGGGAAHGTLDNCTLTGNSARDSGGGAAECSLNNCIVYFNTAPFNVNYAYGTLNYCCTTPGPDGVGNITNDPLLASAACLNPGSPCRGAGSPNYISGVDFDGESWATPPAMGCDEYYPGKVTGPLTVSILTTLTNVAVGYPVVLTAVIEGRATASVWEYGDGVSVSNRPSASHTWNAAGEYRVDLRAYNETLPEGVVASVWVQVAATTHHVSVASANPVPPFSSWETAARTIQDAVDAATETGALILVTNGVYETGGRAVYGAMTNRVAVDKPVMVRSVNGPRFTVIQGWQVPGTTNGDDAVRCVYITNGASLSGFTLTRGATRAVGNDFAERCGGGVWCELGAQVSNCMITENSAAYWGGGVYSGIVNNCAIIGNSAEVGGGAANGGSSTLNNCTVTGNSATICGGVFQAAIYNCIVYFNRALWHENHSEPYNINFSCTTPLPSRGTSNISDDPQLASGTHLSAGSPCLAAGSAEYAKGSDIDGESWAAVPSIGCDEYHDGAVRGPLTVGFIAAFTNVATGFSADFTALIEGPTGASVWDFGDSVVVSNRPYASHVWELPGDYKVVLRAYNDSYAAGVSATQVIRVLVPTVHYVAAANTNPIPPFTSWTTAATTIQDAIDAASLPGALVLVTNGEYATGGRAVSGLLTNRVAVDKPLRVRSVNGPNFTFIRGYQLPWTSNGDGAVRCAYLANGASLAGFTLSHGATLTNGFTDGGGVWCESTNALVSDCAILGNTAADSGGGAWFGTVSNCVLIGNSAGYGGGGAASATLLKCALTNNWAGAGGGASSCTLENCTLANNSARASGGGAVGGGAAYGVLNNCILTGNTAEYGGGVGYYSVLNNCVLTENHATTEGGGAFIATLNNCIVYFNTAAIGPNYSSATMSYCCTTPRPGGAGNITSEPLFLDRTAGNLRLQSNSPCIDAGSNEYVASTSDLDGRPRVVGGTVDIGAYEFDPGVSGLFIGWLRQYGLPSDGSADYADSDQEGLNNWQEWRCGTNPTNALSALRLLYVWPTPGSTTVSWQSVSGRTYFVESSTDLSQFTLLAAGVKGKAGTMSYTDTNVTTLPGRFYRVGVGN